MAGCSKRVDVVAVALRAASEVIGGHAERVASSVGSVCGSAESSGAAAAAMHAAWGEYCGVFGARLSAASAALTVASRTFVAMDDANSAALTLVAPVQAL